MNTQTHIIRKPVCFHCGSEKELKPYQSYMWGAWHICRRCAIEAAKERRKRRQAK